MKLKYFSDKAEAILDHMRDYPMMAGYVFGTEIYFTYIRPNFKTH